MENTRRYPYSNSVSAKAAKTDEADKADTKAKPPRGVFRRLLRFLAWLILLTAVLLLLLLHPIFVSAFHDADTRVALQGNERDDASRMNATSLSEEVLVPADKESLLRELRDLLLRAERENRQVSIAGARHSMGGHTLYPGGIALDMSHFASLEMLDSNTLRAGAGARWHQVIAFLNQRDLSVGIMQSNNSFSIGGSISVNCHGWQFGRPPICDTVEGFTMLMADGELKRCSREENAELFSLALGGYGLFGVILEVDLTVVPNERYRVEQHVISALDAISFFDEHVAGNEQVAMAYGRMRIDREFLLDEITVSLLHKEAEPVHHQEEVSSAGLRSLRRHLFRGSIYSDYGKKLRWWAETKAQPHIQAPTVWRNNLMSEPATVFENRSEDSTDILHEYFVPKSGLDAFILGLYGILDDENENLLNVTVRHVAKDDTTFLTYAQEDSLAFVMLFHQPRTEAGEADMQRLASRIIDAAADAGGRYYLPYRLHASKEQFHRAYPQANEFFKLKRKYDPRERFQNMFYQRYGK